MSPHLTIEKAKLALSKESKPFVLMMKNKAMSVEYFSPKNNDMQTSHLQDELYVICSGSAEFLRKVERINCKTGDVIFVPAGMKHHFENFTEDFATWVIFY